MSDPLLYFWFFVKASLFSSGGTGNLPSLHADLITAGFATESQFAESLTIGQLAPGPNGLWSVSLGYLTGGWGGAALALIAALLPPFLILAVERLYRRIESHPAVEGFVRGLSLAIVGVFVVILGRLLLSGAGGMDYRSLLLVLLAIGLASIRRVPIFAIIALAGGAGILLYR
ncbi:MAG: chromate transporter [Cytophagales bacterium]|nr:chromate transporter [Armatimonadota bacterium]